MTRWFAFSNDHQRGRARDWLATEGYVPTRPYGPSTRANAQAAE